MKAFRSLQPFPLRQGALRKIQQRRQRTFSSPDQGHNMGTGKKLLKLNLVTNQ
jgi:hypothetical protein